MLWSHNDSGDAPTLYAIDLKGTLLAKVAVLDAVAIDWEDIAGGPCPEDGRHDSAASTSPTPATTIARATSSPSTSSTSRSISAADPARPLTVKARVVPLPLSRPRPKIPRRIAVLPNGDVTIVTKGRTPTIAFFGFSKADIVKAP